MPFVRTEIFPDRESGGLLALVVTELRRPHRIQAASVVHLVIDPSRQLNGAL
jgi:hypothetical protein